MAGRHKWADVRAKAAALDPDFEAGVARERHRLEVIEGLHALRAKRGTLQGELAEVLGMSQANVSRIEREADLKLSTVRGYVHALGGSLELHAVFPDGKDVVLTESRAAKA
jgi:DNA-binding XRE family transcriptional regulator